MAKKSKVQIEFQANTQSFNQGIKEADQSLGTLRKELNLNSAELKDNADDVDLLAKRKEILKNQSDETSKKIENLKNKLEIAKETFGENSNEVRLLSNKLLDTQTSFVKIQNEVKQTDSKLNSLNNELNETEKEMNEAEDSADDLSDGFTTMKGVMADLIADGIQAVGQSLKDLVVDSDTAMSNFQAQTGLSTDEMKDFESAIESVYSNNFGESINDIANSMALVKQHTKETDPSVLQKLTENALTLRDTFDFDVNESMKAVNSLMNQFGMSGDEAFNLIVQGTQKGLNANGDLMDIINEYSVHFAQMGLDGEEMFNILTAGAENGAFSIDKVGDAMKEFGIRAIDGSDSTKQAFEDLGLNADEITKKFAKGGVDGAKAYYEVTEAIKSMKDPIKQNEVGVALFGTMWEDLGVDVVSNMGNIDDAYNRTTESMQELTNVKYDNVTSQMSEIGRMIQTDFIIPLAQTLLPILKDGLKWIADNLNWLVPVVVGIGTAFATYFAVTKIIGLINVFKTMFTLIKGGTTIFGALNTVMALNPIGLIIAAIVGLIAIFVVLWNKCDWFRNGVKTLWNKVKEIFLGGVNAIKNKFTEFKTSIGQLKDNAVEKFNALKDKAKSVFDKLKGIITNPINKAKDLVKKAVDKIKSFFDFDWKLPKPKIPSFKVSGGKAPWGFMGKGKLPSVSVKWNKDGAIFTRPTIFPTNKGLQGVGEAGAEAVLPIEKLENWINRMGSNIVNHNYYASDKIDKLIEITERIYGKDMNTYIDSVQVSKSIAEPSDKVNSTRYNLKNRGLIL